MTTTITIPKPGQIVRVRSRQYLVSNVHQTTLQVNQLPSELGQNPCGQTQHLVSLSSIEDDGLGEELELIWEVEVGKVVFEKIELPQPTGFDSPERLDAFLDAVRWNTASNADVRTIQSPFRSGIDIEDYQLDPVVRAIQMSRVNLLIADDVGLGKTIEAGLVAQELIIRHRCQRILIICPSSLQVQWQEQMRDKFGLDFRIIDGTLMKELRRKRGIHFNPWQHFPRLITSIDFLKRDRPLRLIKEVLPSKEESIYPRKFDLLIVDEAHNIAPAGNGKYAVDSMRTSAIRLLVPHFEHKLFLTATPHNGYPESFTALLELLDSQRFARGVTPDRKQLELVMVRRLKQEIRNWDGSPLFPERKLIAIPVDYSLGERQVHTALKEYTALRGQDMVDNTEKYATEFVLKLLKKRLFSSPAAFATTLEQHQQSLTNARHSTNLSRPSEGILRRQLQEMEEDFADDDVYEQSNDEVITHTSRLFRELNNQEKVLLAQMCQWAENACRTPDAKAKELLNWISTHIKPDGKWSDERVIIFTEYRTTQKWLYDLLASEGLVQQERLMTLYGGMKSEEREKIKAAFQANPQISPVRILLATDAASEGLDLQNFCCQLIHYEIPWNPNRMEQRNGRIDRHGQKAAQVLIYHFVGKYQENNLQSTKIKPGQLEGDLEFLMRAAVKVNNIREDLGKVGPVIAAQVEDAMMGRSTVLDTTIAEKESETLRKMLKFERQVKEKIEKLTEQRQETRQHLRLTPDNIQKVVEVGLELAGQPPLIEDELPGINGKVFYLPPLKSSWAICTQGLAHPHTKKIRPIVFDPELSNGRDDVVWAHLNHHLVQMCSRLLRAEIWSNTSKKSLHRVAARLVSNSVLDTPAIIVYGRLIILGGDQQRIHEEIINAGGLIKEGKLKRMGVMEIQTALSKVLPDLVPDNTRKSLQKLWSSHENSLMQFLQIRMQDRSESLRKVLSNKENIDINDITNVLRELQNSIERELEQPQVKQMELALFNETEKEQFERNLSSLKHRLAEIPLEIEREVAAIKARFINTTPRLFPLAVVYLVPKKFA